MSMSSFFTTLQILLFYFMAIANVKLSKKELLLVCDEQFILTKNRVIDKVYHLFGDLCGQFTNTEKKYPNIFPAEAINYSPKIYKGEQYKGLPYVLLDCPRLFFKGNIFAIRCFFWWGNFFSITLHLAGRYAETYGPPVFKKLKKNNSWYICVNENEWEHHFGEDNYLSADNKLFNSVGVEAMRQKKFFKIAKKIPLQQWNDAYDFFVESYGEIIAMLENG